jgi:hypothetical protein
VTRSLHSNASHSNTCEQEERTASEICACEKEERGVEEEEAASVGGRM